MKKVIAIILCICTVLLALCSCTTTETFEASGFSSYIKIGKYKGLKVDKNSEEYKDYFKKMHLNNIAKSNLYNHTEEGKVEFGDVANIDYIGTIDGIPFEGGTDNAYNLTIGSGRFIEGFEDGLIGVSVGERVDLHLTFPSNYDNSELAGKACVFTVKVNYRDVPKTPEESFKELGFKTVDEYKASIDKLCIENFVTAEFIKNCKIKSDPDVENFKAIVILNYYNSLCLEGYGMSIEDYLKNNGSTMNDFVDGMINNLSDNPFETNAEMKAVRDALLGYYAIYDEEGLEYDEKDLGDSEGYERCYKESLLIKELAIGVLVDNAKIVG